MVWAWVVIVANGVAGLWALGAHGRPGLRGRALWWFTALAELAIVAQVVLGVVLVAGQDRQVAQFHMFYGYVALAADPYGDATVARDLPHAIELMNGVVSDLGKWRARARAALDALVAQPGVDKTKLAAIGYCMGGSTSLELGRSGAPLAAIVSFHGGLQMPKPEDSQNIRAKVLVCTGADDPLIPPAQVTAFIEQMQKTKVDWQVHSYGGVVHSFTNPDATAKGERHNMPLAYDEHADRESWKALMEFIR